MAATTQTLSVGTDELGPVPVTYTDRGEGKPFLLLHGGGGPSTVSAFADLLAKERSARVVVPIHPGYAGTPRPDSLRTVAALATLYASLLVELDLRGVTVVGNSMGGWIAAEMALLGLSRVSNFILIDAVGINAEGHPIADFFSMTPRQIAEASYRQQIEVDSNRRIIVGVNKYATSERPSIPILAMDPKGYDRQIERLNKLRQTRNNAKVEAALSALRAACQSSENVMPHLITAAKAYATLSEITDVMREVFGVYHEPVAI